MGDTRDEYAVTVTVMVLSWGRRNHRNPTPTRTVEAQPSFSTLVSPVRSRSVRKEGEIIRITVGDSDQQRSLPRIYSYVTRITYI